MVAKKERVRKKATNLSIRVDLLRAARKRRLNLSSVLESALTERLQAEDQRAWLLQNAPAIDDYAAHIGKQGVFSDGVRRF